jgi:prepilin-type N-terminal cleavage/methylation domain-containing protein
MRRATAGFTLVEVLVATAITLIVTGLACALAIDAQAAWRADQARVDLQQRARVAADTLTRALHEAGAGALTGPMRSGLVNVLPPVIPRRIGIRHADPFTALRTDVVSLVHVAAHAEPAELLIASGAGASALDISPSTCTLPACGFDAGEHVLVHDDRGNYDVFTITAVAGLTLAVRHHGSGSAVSYPAGSPILAVESASYSFDRAAKALRVYDGDTSDLPVLDDVVGMSVEYAGEGLPPVWPKPAAGQENCLYDAEGAYRTGLLPVLSADVSPVRLPPELLVDGPWCGSGSNQFDADLLRIRRVRVLIRLQAPDVSLRGSSPALFRHPGTGRASGDTAPDVTVVVDVSPRNLGQGRKP